GEACAVLFGEFKRHRKGRGRREFLACCHSHETAFQLLGHLLVLCLSISTHLPIRCAARASNAKMSTAARAKPAFLTLRSFGSYSARRPSPAELTLLRPI